MNELIIKNKELASLYQESVDAGTQDAGEAGVYPMVKITAALSKENTLTNGEASKIGSLYHTELKQDFLVLQTNICYVGKYMLPDYNTKEPKQTYVVGAVMEDNSPFVMFVKGYSLQNMWQFMGEVANIKNRFRLPMYPLSVEISTVKRPHEKFKSVDVFKFSIKRGADSVPIVEQDMERATALRGLTDKFKEVIHNMTKTESEVDEYADRANHTDDDFQGEVDTDQVAYDDTKVADDVEKALRDVGLNIK